MTEGTDVRIDLYEDDEGLYQAEVRIEDGTPDGHTILVDPRNVFTHKPEPLSNPTGATHHPDDPDGIVLR